MGETGAKQRIMDWRPAHGEPPARGAFVEIGRIDHTGDIAALDKLWWYPEYGNWNLVGMWWRPANEGA